MSFLGMFDSFGLFRAASQIITGHLLTQEQLTALSRGIAGNILGEWLATPEDERRAEEKVEAAKTHIAEATRILSALQTEMEEKSDRLTTLAREIEEKKQAAQHYGALAQTNQEAFAPFG